VFAARQARPKRKRPLNGKLQPETPPGAISTFRASVGDFALRPAQFGWQLEIQVGKVRRLLAVYETTEAALLALRNRRTEFEPWDHMGRNAVAIQLDTPERWDRIAQKP
jgi:hypothetical protein